MAIPTLLTERPLTGILECGCPNCSEPLVIGLLEVAGGETVETVTCPNDCDLRPFTFQEHTNG